MDALGFVASIVSSLAWPGVVLAAIFLLRRPLAQLIPTIQRVKYKELAVEFGRRVEEAAVEAQDILPDVQAPKALAPEAQTELVRLAETSPRTVVLEAWLQLETAAGEAVRRLNLTLRGSPPRSTSQSLRALEQSGRLNAAITGTIHDLRSLRNEAVHYPDFAISVAAAMTYHNVARAIASILRDMPLDAA